MSRYSARAQWNTANARLANKPFDDLFKRKDDEMSEIDDLLDFVDLGLIDTQPARAELAQLRAENAALRERLEQLVELGNKYAECGTQEDE